MTVCVPHYLLLRILSRPVHRNLVWYSFARLFICFAARSVALEQRNMLAWILKVIKRWSIIKSKENFYRSLNSGHLRFSVDVSVIVIFEEVYTVLIFFLKNFVPYTVVEIVLPAGDRFCNYFRWLRYTEGSSGMIYFEGKLFDDDGWNANCSF